MKTHIPAAVSAGVAFLGVCGIVLVQIAQQTKIEALSERIDKGFQAKIEALSEGLDKGFQQVGERIDKLEERIDKLEERLDKGFTQMASSIDNLKSSMDNLESSMDNLKSSMDLNSRLSYLEGRKAEKDRLR